MPARIDPEKLNALFHAQPRDVEEIHLQLRSIASIAAAACRCSKSDRKDLVSEIHVHLIRTLPKYDPARNCAFTYFMRCAVRASQDIAEKLGRDRRRTVTLPEEVSGATASRPPMQAMAGPTWKNRDWLRRIDRYLGKLRDHGNHADSSHAEEYSRLRDLRLMVSVLQALRRDMVASYRPLEMPGIRYTRDRKIPVEA